MGLNEHGMDFLDTVLREEAALVIDVDVAVLLDLHSEIARRVILGPEVRPIPHSARIRNQKVNSIHANTIAYKSEMSKTFFKNLCAPHPVESPPDPRPPLPTEEGDEGQGVLCSTYPALPGHLGSVKLGDKNTI